MSKKNGNGNGKDLFKKLDDELNIWFKIGDGETKKVKFDRNKAEEKEDTRNPGKMIQELTVYDYTKETEKKWTPPVSVVRRVVGEMQNRHADVMDFNITKTRIGPGQKDVRYNTEVAEQ